MNWLNFLQERGDSGFRSFFDAHHRHVYRFMMRFTKTSAAAEDCTQLTFIKFWERLKNIDATTPPEIQLFQIAKSVVIDYLRAETSRQKLLTELSTEKHIQTENQDEAIQARLDLVHKAIENLPNRQREIFKLSREYGLTYEEIAEQLSISKNTVHVHISKALLTLRSKLAGWLLF